jgi:hypothetical protein
LLKYHQHHQNKFDDPIIQMFNHVLTLTYFQFEGQFYEQNEGVAVGSPLSLAIANFYVEHSKGQALATALYDRSISTNMCMIPLLCGHVDQKPLKNPCNT